MSGVSLILAESRDCRVFMLRFFAAWLSDWTSRMSGLASVVLALWAAFFTPDAALNKWVLVGLSILFFVIGSYHIWAKEHRALVAERIYPDIRGRIVEDFIYVGSTRRQFSVTFIPVVVSLVNHREAEAAIDRYELTIITGDKEYKARNIPTQGMKLTRPAFDNFGLRTNPEGVSEEYKDLFKHRHEPLKRGVPQYGWLLFVLAETLIQPNMNCSLRLSVVDVLGGTHTLPDTKRTAKQSGTVAIPIEINIDLDDNIPRSGMTADVFNDRDADI
jgi:hypothetical protein